MPLIGKEIRAGCCFTSQDNTGWSWLWHVMSSKRQLVQWAETWRWRRKRPASTAGKGGKCWGDRVPSKWNMDWLLLSCFSRVRPCATPQTAAHQASLSLGFCGALQRDSWGLTKPPHFLSVCEGGKQHSSYFFSSGLVLRCHAANS